MTKKRIRIKVGDIVKIDLEDGTFSFGRVLESPLMAFYDLHVTNEASIEEIVSSPILFKVWVMHRAVKSGRWPVIGSLPLESELQKPVDFFIQDSITGELSIYRDDGPISTTYAECEELECASVWDPEYVEDRLRDHYADVPNQWVESLKIKIHPKDIPR